MYNIQQITDSPGQSLTIILENGIPLNLTLVYIPMQYGWFLTSISYQNFSVNGVRVVVSPNMLHQYRNQIPFGIGCFTAESREPTQQEDFSSEAFSLSILSAAEVLQYEEYLTGVS